MFIDPLAAFAVTLAFSIGGVTYVLKMAKIEAQQRGRSPRRRVL